MKPSDDARRLKHYHGAGRYPFESLTCYSYQTRYEAYHYYAASKDCTTEQRNKLLEILSLPGGSKFREYLQFRQSLG